MAGKSKSTKQATNATRVSSVESLSEDLIRKELRSYAIQQPSTILPLTLCALSVIYLLLFSPVIGGALGAIIVIIASGLVAAGSFFWRYSIRYSQEYETRVQEIMALQEQEQEKVEKAELRRLRENLQSEFSSINSADGLKAIENLFREYEQLQLTVDREKGTDLLAVAHIPSLAEQTYKQGLSVLEDTLELARVIQSSDKERLEAEIEEMERETESLRGDETQAEQVEIKEATVDSHKERLEMIDQQQLRVDKLLYQCDRCEASLHRTRIEIAAIKAESSETSVSAVLETLQTTINQAKEVQEELRRLGY